jgi:serine/threonine-protein kinase RsbW
MINKKYLQSDFIARLTILSDEKFIAQAQEFVLFYARYFDFSGSELQRIELITEEAILNTIQNTFGEEEIGTIDVKIVYKPGRFIISIEDRGIPVDFRKLETQEKSALGIHLMKNLADEFQFINLGKEGKRLELVKHLPEESISDMLSRDDKEKLEGEKETEATDHPYIRLVSPEDAEMLARLAYRVYGYTYFSFFYFPEKIRELIENGLLVSAVAVNQSDEIVGNLCLFFETPDAKVADSGSAMVDPRYRGHSLFKKMKLFLKEYAIRTKMYGLYSEAVTIHPFTQQGNISIGAKETGIMLAYVKEKLSFKKINEDRLSEQRQAVVLYYLKTSQEPSRRVFICEKFYPIIHKVYSNLGLQREVIKTGNLADHQSTVQNSLVSTSVKPDQNVAVISISVIGQDAFDLVRQQLREFCLNKVETIYLEIPVDSPCSAMLADRMTGLGFMLSGIVPELRNGDCLKLQYLNNVRVDPAKITIASELGRELLAEIVKTGRQLP